MNVLNGQRFIRLSGIAVSMDDLTRRVDEVGRTTSENSDQITQIFTAIRQLLAPLELPRYQVCFTRGP
jgi:hypothetical protein